MKTRYAAAESFATLAMGLWSVSLIGYLGSGVSGRTHFLGVVGAMSALFALYLILPTRWRQESVSGRIGERGYLRIVRSVGWLTVGLVFGTGLVQSGVLWMIIAGLTTMIVAFIGFYVAMFRLTGK